MVVRRCMLTASSSSTSIRRPQTLATSQKLLKYTQQQRKLLPCTTTLALRAYSTETQPPPFSTIPTTSAPLDPTASIDTHHTHTHIHDHNCTHPHHPHSHPFQNPHVNNSQLHQPPVASAPTTPLPNPEAVHIARNHTANLLRTNDYPSHVLLPFLPPGPARDLYLSLKALNLSTASIPEQVRTPALGLLRIKFWRDSIERIFASVSGQPTTPPPPPPPPAQTSTSSPSPPKIAPNTTTPHDNTTTISTATGVTEPSLLLLHHILTTPLPQPPHNPPHLTKSFLLRALTARAGVIKNPTSPFHTLADMERYAEAVYAGPHYLLLELLFQLYPSPGGPGTPELTLARRQELEHVASHLGKAMGIVALLRGLSLSAAKARLSVAPNMQAGGGVSGLRGDAGRLASVSLPTELLSKYGISPEHLFYYVSSPPSGRTGGGGAAAEGTNALPTLPDLVLEVATLANDHLNEARRMVKDGAIGAKSVGRGVWGSFLQAGVPVAVYLEALERVGFDVFARELLEGGGGAATAGSQAGSVNGAGGGAAGGGGGVLGGWRLPWRAFRSDWSGRF